MASRKDQLWSYQFMLQRVMSALVYRKTDADKSPFRAAGAAVFAGIMLAVLALGATVAIAFFKKSFSNNVDWTHGGIVILEKETGSPYVVFPSDEQIEAAVAAGNGDINESVKRVYPVANFTSAALLAGTTETQEVKQQSLTGEVPEDGIDAVPQMGMKIGIEDLPNSVPAPDKLLSARWAVCTDPEGGGGAESVLYVGARPSHNSGLESDQVLLFEDGEEVYVVGEGGYKHKVVEPDVVLSALGLQQQERVPVAPAFAAALQEGQELKAPEITGAGETSSIDGATVGEVYSSTGSGRAEYYVALSDGAAPITQVQAELIMDGLGQNEAEQNRAVGQAASPDSDHYHDYIPNPNNDLATRTAIPERISGVAEGWGGEVACAGFSDGDDAATVMMDVDVRSQGVSTEQASESGKIYADRIVVPPGKGMLVGTGNAGMGAVSLITGTGELFSLATMTGNEEQKYKIVATVPAKDALGYTDAKPVAMPANLISLVPTGPAMDPHAAMENAREIYQ
ncbi:MAG: type VII secretion protein EccB [Stackebrandtia sp.]